MLISVLKPIANLICLCRALLNFKFDASMIRMHFAVQINFALCTSIDFLENIKFTLG